MNVARVLSKGLFILRCGGCSKSSKAEHGRRNIYGLRHPYRHMEASGRYLADSNEHKNHSSRPSTYGKNRTCEHPGCTTVLSQYNPGTACSQHEGKERRRRLRATRIQNE